MLQEAFDYKFKSCSGEGKLGGEWRITYYNFDRCKMEYSEDYSAAICIQCLER